jgi:hypothetical protein
MDRQTDGHKACSQRQLQTKAVQKPNGPWQHEMDRQLVLALTVQVAMSTAVTNGCRLGPLTSFMSTSQIHEVMSASRASTSSEHRLTYKRWRRIVFWSKQTERLNAVNNAYASPPVSTQPGPRGFVQDLASFLGLF